MATVKLILRTSQKLEDETHSIIIRVTKDRKSSIVTLPFSCEIKDWDDKTNLPKNNRLSMLCSKALFEIKELTLESFSREWTARKIIDIYSGKENREALFFDYYVNNVSPDVGGGYSTIQSLETRINKFKEFAGGEIQFIKIDFALLKKYKKHLKDLKSANKYLSAVRQVYNHAIEFEYFEPTRNPFKSSLFVKKVETLNRNLTLSETQALFKYKIKGKRWQRKEFQELALNIWKFCFLMRGMNIVDAVLIENKNLKEYYTFTRQKLKTRSNSKLKVRVPEEARIIINKYYDKKEKYLFPVLENNEDLNASKRAYSQYTYKRNIINRNMKRIGEELNFSIPLTSMSPRYTFVNIAKEIGVPFLFLQELIGHKTMSTTDIYMDAFPQEQLDEYHRKVIDSIL